MLGNDGALYGETQFGGENDYGTIFKIDLSGNLTTLHSFSKNEVNDSVQATTLMQDTNGIFYGTGSDGSIFSLDAGLPLFVDFRLGEGRVGQTVRLLGQGFTGAKIVSFKGVAAAFEVISDSVIGTQVPAGAATGRLTVVTPSGTLKSKRVYVVL